MIYHTSIVHGKCPLNGQWDYYEVEVRTDGFVDVAKLEEAFNAVRGAEKTQEDIAFELRELIPADCVLVVRGQHSQNTKTLVEI